MNEKVLLFKEWTKRRENLENAVSPICDSFLKRRGLQIKHAVHDFLFTYYTFSPTKLKHWVPSIHEKLVINDKTLEEHPWLSGCWYATEGNLLSLNKNNIQESTYKAAAFVATLSDNILKQPPKFNCFGLHEWAMVYKLSHEALRHHDHMLRLPMEELVSFVESQKICCSHYDAFRFFTKEALPLNVLNPVLETRAEMEQGGCLHANMDLYKWATRFWPWIGSDFIAKTFFHALEGRELDMRASPYDLKKAGYEPICIETEEGQKEYQREQRLFAEKSIALRKELSAFCKQLLQK